MTSRAALAAPTLLLALALNACGGDDEPGGGTEGEGASDVPAQVCPGELDATGIVVVEGATGAPVALGDTIVAVVGGRLVTGTGEGELTPSGLEEQDLSLDGAVGDDLLVSFRGEDGAVLRRVTLDGETVWETTVADAGPGADLDPVAGTLEVGTTSDELYFSVDDGAEVDVPEDGLGDLTLQDGDTGLVRLDASDSLLLFGDLSFDGNERYVVTDLDRDDRQELTGETKLVAKLCGTSVYATDPGGTALDVYDGTAVADGPSQTVELPGAADVALVVGEGYVSVRGVDENWWVLTG